MKKSQIWNLICSLIFVLIVFQISQRSELAGETWGYWFFNKIFKLDGHFPITERSPIYILYLCLFSWLDYPYSFMVERFFTSLFLITSMMYFFRYYLGRNLAFLATIMAAPFIISSEPPAQALGIGFICLAMIFRSNVKATRFNFSVSYAFFCIAFMFRSTNIFFPIFFLGFDIFSHVKNFRISQAKLILRPRLSDWPLAVVFGLFLLMANLQSTHRWNNAWFTDTRWFPSTGKSLRDAGFIGGYNQTYIQQQKKNISQQDFYFTNKEVFKGESTMLGAIRANPAFIKKQLKVNVYELLRTFFSFFLLGEMFYPFTSVGILILAIGIVFSDFKPVLQFGHILAFGAAAVASVAVSILVLVNSRYFPPLLIALPLFVSLVVHRFSNGLLLIYKKPKFAFLMSCFVVAIFGSPLLGRITSIRFFVFILALLGGGLFTLLSIFNFDYSYFLKKFTPSIFVKNILLIVCVIIFLLPVESREAWQPLLRDTKVGNFSAEKSHNKIVSLIKNCKGVMSFESLLLGGLYNFPQEKVYSVFEIPPFGKWGDSIYQGLEPGRIDCLLLSSHLVKFQPSAVPTNVNIRYQNYIEPYSKFLLGKGAKKCKIDNYGTAIILAPVDAVQFECE